MVFLLDMDEVGRGCSCHFVSTWAQAQFISLTSVCRVEHFCFVMRSTVLAFLVAQLHGVKTDTFAGSVSEMGL